MVGQMILINNFAGGMRVIGEVIGTQDGYYKAVFDFDIIRNKDLRNIVKLNKCYFCSKNMELVTTKTKLTDILGYEQIKVNGEEYAIIPKYLINNK